MLYEQTKMEESKCIKWHFLNKIFVKLYGPVSSLMDLGK